jgi:serine/threonine protein kinase
MSKMETSDGFAKIKDRTNIQDFFIMTLLGENLQNIIEKYTLNVIDVKRIAYQCLLRLKDLHQAGFVHRDIKPENILLGNQNNPHKLYVVDFGLSSTYKKSAQVARKLYQGEIGTIKFCPIASHKCL